MRMDKLTSRLQGALADAQSLAVGRDHTQIEPVHLLLLDMHLPEMDGTRIIKRLETMIPPVSVRTIVITGDTISEDIRKFAADHSLPLVMKPVDIDQLNQLLQDTAAAD